MREILFRGKTTDTGEWIEGFYFYKDRTQEHGIHCSVSMGVLMDRAFEVIPETIGQFTGLTDKKKVKIFEGDIVKFKNEEGDGVEQTSIVKWDLGGLVVYGNYGDYDITTIGWAIEDLGECEIIGNIHDNPELSK